MNILFLSGREPGYARNNIIRKGLLKNKVQLIDCTSSSKNIFFRYTSVVFKFFSNYFKKYDLIYIGFYGQPLVPIIRLFTKKPIIFDAFLSTYDTLVHDTKKIKKNTFLSRLAHKLDEVSCKLADVILLDTDEHISYFVKEFGIPKKKFHRIFIGADNEIFKPARSRKKGRFKVEFHGNFIPLQGAEYIVQAAKMLEKYDIGFIMIGAGQAFNKCHDLAKKLKLKNISFKGKKPVDKIPEYISRSDIGLGIFGKTDKAKRVIPNKAYEIVAMKKPLVTADTKASRELFSDNDVIFCKIADPDSLSKAILKLRNNKALMLRIGESGYRKFKKHCTPEIVGKKIKSIAARIS